jgi:hypothetical protein
MGLIWIDVQLAADFVDANLYHGATGGLFLVDWLEWLACRVLLDQQIQKNCFFGGIDDYARLAEREHGLVASGAGAGAILGDRHLGRFAHFKADPVVFGEIVEFPGRQFAVEDDLSVVKDIIERSYVRLAGAVAGSEAAFGSGCEERACVFFRHPANGHWDRVSEVEVYQGAGREWCSFR